MLRLIAMKYCESETTEASAFFGGSEEIKIPTSFMFYLIISGERKILVDVGCEDMCGWPAYHYIKPVDLLRKYGVQPEDITDVILTHSHFDHAGPIDYYANAEFYIQTQEYVETDGDQKFAGKTVHLFEDEYLLCGRFLIKRIGGHSNNSCVVFFENNSVPYVLAGDEIYNQNNIDKQIPMGNAVNIVRNRDFIAMCKKKCLKAFSCHSYDFLIGNNGYQVLIEDI